MRCKRRRHGQADLLAGEGREKFQLLRMKRLGWQNQRRQIVLRERARSLTQKQFVVRSVQLVAQKREAQRAERGPDLMKPSRVRRAFHQAPLPVGCQKTELRFGRLDPALVSLRFFPEEFSLLRHGALRIRSQISAGFQVLGKTPEDDGLIGFPDPAVLEEFRQTFRRPRRLRKQYEPRRLPVQPVDRVHLSESFPEKHQKRVAEVSARRMDRDVSGLSDGQKIGCFIFDRERFVHRRLLKFRFRGNEIHRLSRTQDPGGAHRPAADQDLAFPHGFLPLGTGAVGEPFGQKRIEPLPVRFGPDDGADGALFGLRRSQGNCFFRVFFHLEFVFFHSFAII